MSRTHACPKCGRQLAAAGDVTDPQGGPPLPVFQCDECIAVWQLDGQRFDHALTFAVDAVGRVLDASTLEPFDCCNN